MTQFQGQFVEERIRRAFTREEPHFVAELNELFGEAYTEKAGAARY